MTKSKTSNSATSSAPADADRLARSMFDHLTAQPLPDHLVELADELETARNAGRLRRPDEAA